MREVVNQGNEAVITRLEQQLTACGKTFSVLEGATLLGLFDSRWAGGGLGGDGSAPGGQRSQGPQAAPAPRRPAAPTPPPTPLPHPLRSIAGCDSVDWVAVNATACAAALDVTDTACPEECANTLGQLPMPCLDGVQASNSTDAMLLVDRCMSQM